MKGWKTVAFNVIMSAWMLISLLNPEATTPDAVELKGMLDQAEPLIAAIWGLGNIVLRAVTDTAIFKKE